MDKNYQTLMDSIWPKIDTAQNIKDLDILKAKVLGKEGLLSSALRTLSTLSGEERRLKGEQLNLLKERFQNALAQRKFTLEQQEWQKRLQGQRIDVSLPVETGQASKGRYHPLSFVLSEILDIFALDGFSTRSGPDIETAEHNFSALNVPEHHPARAMQDTFYIDGGALLRTHTSPVQIRTMRSEGAGLRIVAPGRVYRCDYDQTHTPMFHQIEGLVIEKGVHMGHLRGCLENFFSRFFGQSMTCRFRPSFFPFTEPSAEVDIPCQKIGKNLSVGSGNDWLEVLGCGMIHPQVLRNVGLDPENHQGFAFGMGIERMAMLKYGISDLRDFFMNDEAFLKHYGSGLGDVRW